MSRLKLTAAVMGGFAAGWIGKGFMPPEVATVEPEVAYRPVPTQTVAPTPSPAPTPAAPVQSETGTVESVITQKDTGQFDVEIHDKLHNEHTLPAWHSLDYWKTHAVADDPYEIEKLARALAADPAYEQETYQLLSLIQTESGFSMNAQARPNAVGLLQLTLTDEVVAAYKTVTGATLNPILAELAPAEINLKVGTLYLRALTAEYSKKVRSKPAAFRLALAAKHKNKQWVDDTLLPLVQQGRPFSSLMKEMGRSTWDYVGNAIGNKSIWIERKHGCKQLKNKHIKRVRNAKGFYLKEKDQIEIRAYCEALTGIW